MNLSKRLTQVAKFIPKGMICADIGTDHGYLPIYLVQTGIAPKVIAADVNKGPLNAATKNVQNYGLADKIELRLGNGLAVLTPKEVQCVSICGMGGSLMCEILDNSSEIIAELEYLVLAPNIAPELIRSWAKKNNWAIDNEELILEDGRFYPIIALKKGKMDELNTAKLYAGPVLLDNKHTLLGEYLRQLRQKELALAAQLLQIGQAATVEKGNDLYKKWQIIEEEYQCKFMQAL